MLTVHLDAFCALHDVFCFGIAKTVLKINKIQKGDARWNLKIKRDAG